ncbi:MAG: hypothetical protein H0W55_09495 [Actinobacteria bacterium]|nr:hypothetical protein [Actinomycetota bacterium]MDQ3532727.1 hypothetical protein [Actinomycetota bacterium]
MSVGRRAHLVVVVGIVMTLFGQAGASPQEVPPRAKSLKESRQRFLFDRLGPSSAVTSPATQERTRVPTVGKAENFNVLDHVSLGGGAPDADVELFDHGGAVGEHAYVGTWAAGCTGRGVKIVDVSRPSRSELVATARLRRDEVSYEDPVVKKIHKRDVLAVGVQDCNFGPNGGLALFDVTHPKRPEKLSYLPVPVSFGGVHELDVARRPGGRVIALLAVPFSTRGGDFRIVNITYPKHPETLAAWDIVKDSSLEITAGDREITSLGQGIGYFNAYFGHSARAADHATTAYVSYWDAGVLKFDISRLRRPQLVGRTTFQADDDGDAHSMTPYKSGGERYILQNDEDEESQSPPRVTSNATGTRQYPAIEALGLPTPVLTQTGPVSGLFHDAGSGCSAEDFEGGEGRIVAFEFEDPFSRNSPCGVGRQLVLAARAGARAVLVNSFRPYRPDSFFLSGFFCCRKVRDELAKKAKDMAIVAVADIDGLVDSIRATPDPRGVRVNLAPRIPSLGFLRIFAESTAADTNGDGVAEYRQVGRFAGLPHVRGQLHTPRGLWSIHNTEVMGNRAYSSWYSHGIVALDMTDPTDPTKVGQFVPPTDDERRQTLGRGPAMTWGLALDKQSGLIYVSDMRTGLWIVKPTGPAAPSG